MPNFDDFKLAIEAMRAVRIPSFLMTWKCHL